MRNGKVTPNSAEASQISKSLEGGPGLSGPLMKLRGVCDVKVDPSHGRVVVRFDARKTHAPDLHDAILKSGYKPAARVE